MRERASEEQSRNDSVTTDGKLSVSLRSQAGDKPRTTKNQDAETAQFSALRFMLHYTRIYYSILQKEL